MNLRSKVVNLSQRGRQALTVVFLALGLMIPVVLAARGFASPALSPVAYLPEVFWSPMPMVEVRGLWVTRFDWTNYGQPAQKSRIDEIVNDASRAGFNVIYFQVRGVADAYYQPGPEPWAQRVSGQSLGTAPNPYWDPLAYFIKKAHQKKIQLHAYINVYPVWDNCSQAPPPTSPEHFYYKLANYHGTTGGKLNGLQWNSDGSVSCSGYVRATPASVFGDNHYLAVARYLAGNYNIDGLHLDHIRYAGRSTSCDPVSAWASGKACFQTPAGYASYQAWQRAQVNGTVEKFYQLVEDEHPNLMLSAAVWPTYIDRWDYRFSQGYYDFYQDSQAWMQDGYIDAISPMIYGTDLYNRSVWRTLVQDFQDHSGGRFVIPGIGSAGYDSFDEIESRIQTARSIGTAGHAIFSYSGLKGKAGDYFQKLADGPYERDAVVPMPYWR